MNSQFKLIALVFFSTFFISCENWEKSYYENQIVVLEEEVKKLEDSISDQSHRIYYSKFLAVPSKLNPKDETEYHFLIQSIEKLPMYKFYAVYKDRNRELILDSLTSPSFTYKPEFLKGEKSLDFEAQFELKNEIIVMPVTITKNN